MLLLQRLARLLTGTDPKLRRLLRYWAATGAIYAGSFALLWLETVNGIAPKGASTVLSLATGAGLVIFYLLVRNHDRLGIEPWQLALWQAAFALACNVTAYAFTGPVRGAALMMMLVIVVFCMFSLRPHQVLGLSACTLLGLGAVSFSLVHSDPVAYPVTVESIHMVLAAISLAAVSILTGEMHTLRRRLKQQKEELLQAVATIRTLATIDELTSLANRRHMNEVLSAQERRLRVHHQPVCLALLDIDFFKNVNDRYGHAGGDAVLRAFADAAREELRAADVLARWGGEEFLLMLPDTELPEAMVVMQRMAARFSNTAIAGLDAALRITFSAGVVIRRDHEPFSETINRADKAMYVAKQTGRNRIVPGD